MRAQPWSDDIAIMAATTSTRTLAPIRGRVADETVPAAPTRGKGLLPRALRALRPLRRLASDRTGFGQWLYNVLLVGSAFVCLARPLRRSKERAAWLCLGATLLLWAAGDFYYTLFLWNQNAAPPTVTDWFWLASYPFLYASIALLVRARTAHFDRSLWLDAVLAALAVAAVGATVLFGAVVESTGGSPLLAAMNLAYPLADTLLLGSSSRCGPHRLEARPNLAVHRRGHGRPRAHRQCLSLPGFLRLGPAPILDAGWPARDAAATAAAWSGPSSVRSGSRVRMLAVPAIFGLTALAILVYGQFKPLNTPAVVLAATSMLAVIAGWPSASARSWCSCSASRIEARADPLAGIGDRRKLIDDLSARLNAQTPAVLILLDLDGFKGYDDSFGHPAGDALLARLAKKLAAAVASDGEVYRIGGDEFCVLGAVEHARRGVRGFGRRGAPGARRGLPDHVRAGLGRAARGGGGRRRGAPARGRPDVRREDGRGPRPAGRAESALRALYERDERLQGRLADIVELVRSVGQELGLSADEIGDLALAAELHEVGKLAIPDSILSKPEPLTEEETRFLRRHPLIGERILSSAPALAKVSRFVRSIHERFDGTGYPDSLAGQEIPFRSRIISACATFIAMTSTSTPDAAIAELRRGAGTEFDPAVLDALASVVAVAEPPLALVEQRLALE